MENQCRQWTKVENSFLTKLEKFNKSPRKRTKKIFYFLVLSLSVVFQWSIFFLWHFHPLRLTSFSSVSLRNFVSKLNLVTSTGEWVAEWMSGWVYVATAATTNDGWWKNRGDFCFLTFYLLFIPDERIIFISSSDSKEKHFQINKILCCKVFLQPPTVLFFALIQNELFSFFLYYSFLYFFFAFLIFRTLGLDSRLSSRSKFILLSFFETPYSSRLQPLQDFVPLNTKLFNRIFMPCFQFWS